MDQYLLDLFKIPTLGYTRSRGSVATHGGEMDPEMFLSSFLPNQRCLNADDLRSSPMTYYIGQKLSHPDPLWVSVGVATLNMRLLRDTNIPVDYSPRVIIDLLEVPQWMKEKNIVMCPAREMDITLRVSYWME